MRRRLELSLRLRLLAGAGLLAAAAIAAAGLGAWGAAETARLIAESTAAQARVDLLGHVSARVNDYALVALESAPAHLGPAERSQRLAPRAVAVRAELRGARPRLCRHGRRRRAAAADRADGPRHPQHRPRADAGELRGAAAADGGA